MREAKGPVRTSEIALHVMRQRGINTADTAAVATAKTERKQKVVHSPVARVHETPVEMLQKTNKNFASYTSSRVLNSFSKDTAKPALPDFMKKLVALKKGKK